MLLEVAGWQYWEATTQKAVAQGQKDRAEQDSVKVATSGRLGHTALLNKDSGAELSVVTELEAGNVADT